MFCPPTENIAKDSVDENSIELYKKKFYSTNKESNVVTLEEVT